MMGRKLSLAMAALLLVMCVGGTAIAQEFVIPEDLPVLAAPVIVTTCGQSPGALMVGLLLGEAGIYYEEIDLLTVDEFLSECPIDTIYDSSGVLFVTTGTSLKGMGAAGVDVDSEVARCTALIEAARERGMVIVVGQVEGAGRRVDEYDELTITAMSPLADLLITRSDVNEDGYFTTLAEELGIPQIFIEDTLDLAILFPLIFVSSEEG
ncbi:hypothetical protein JW848_06200 [Candidatus Bipolaricaulota bacterium]|nr:hypothetical protein [Candidatus Bipolaricaulota bacterium]